MRYLLACLALCFATVVVVHNSTAQNDSDESAVPPKVYRVIERLQIEKLGLDGKLPANDSDEKALERGLNLRYADGWELVAIEGGRMRIFNRGRDASLEIPPSCIFPSLPNWRRTMIEIETVLFLGNLVRDSLKSLHRQPTCR